MHCRGYVRVLSLFTHAHWMHAAIGPAVHVGLQDINSLFGWLVADGWC
jgi:hypothetical protein